MTKEMKDLVSEMAAEIRSTVGACEFVAGCGASSPQVERTAKEWVNASFGPSSARKWWDDGVFDADSAATLRDDQLAADDVSGHKIDGYSIGYRYCNGDITLTTLLKTIAE